MKCPQCLKSESIIPILYGMPTHKLMKEVHEGKLYIGGCALDDNEPTHYCTACNIKFDKSGNVAMSDVDENGFWGDRKK